MRTACNRLGKNKSKVVVSVLVSSMTQEHQKAFGYESLPVPAALVPGALAGRVRALRAMPWSADGRTWPRISSIKPEGQRARGWVMFLTDQTGGVQRTEDTVSILWLT